MMDWWQLLITIISSSALTAFITGIFNFKTIKETNKENERQRKFDSDSKTVHENKLKEEQNEIQKAENLYKIISPAIRCETLRTFIKEPNIYNLDIWADLYEALRSDNNDYDHYSFYNNWLKSNTYRFWNKKYLPFKEYVIDLIKDDLETQHELTEFFQRYNKGTREEVSIDVEKLNNDIDFINKKLNLYIEKF